MVNINVSLRLILYMIIQELSHNNMTDIEKVLFWPSMDVRAIHNLHLFSIGSH